MTGTSLDIGSVAFASATHEQALILGLTLFVMGACWASFSGLVAWRSPSLLGLEGADRPTGIVRADSGCEGCRRPIGIAARIPVLGWVLHRGRCGACGYRVPLRYPLIETLLGTVTVALPFLYGGLDLAVGSVIALAWALLLVSWIDWETAILPEEITVPLLFAGLLLSPAEADPWMRSAGAAAAAFAMWASFALAARMREGVEVSGGDVALIAAAGAWVGFQGLPLLLASVAAAFAAYALPARLRGVVWVPMGPAIAIGMLASVIVATLGWPASGR